MDSPATPADVIVRWRSLSDEETIKTYALLDDAWQLIKLRDPTVETRLEEDPATLEVALVVMVQCAMVIRVLRNPDGKSEEQIEDYRYRRDPSSSTGDLFITDNELDLLAEVTASTGAFTITPYYVPAYYPLLDD